jgi:hypothetical protein
MITKSFKKTLSISKDITCKLSGTEFSDRKFRKFISKILTIYYFVEQLQSESVTSGSFRKQ